MDDRIHRKRPWEDDDLVALDSSSRRETSSAASLTKRRSPLPREAGFLIRDGPDYDQRRLPPLQTLRSNLNDSDTTASAGPDPCLQLSATLCQPRPRAQSFHDNPQQPRSESSGRHAGQPIGIIQSVHTRASPLTQSTDVHRSLAIPDPTPLGAGVGACCPLDCAGQGCSITRNLVRNLVTDLSVLNARIATVIQAEYRPFDEEIDIVTHSIHDVLTNSLGLVQWASARLEEHVEHKSSDILERTSVSRPSPTMRRKQQYLEGREEQSPPMRHSSMTHPDHHGYALPSLLSDHHWRHPHQAELNPIGRSPHHTASSSGSAILLPQSPIQNPQHTPIAILPSPSSLTSVNAPILPSISSPSTSIPASAQSTYLQDLQHQISVKTLAFQTLQREYDALLQRLDRQRTKCAALEKKFEVSDVEINSLTDEKERLQRQITSMETQVEELQQSRDEARRQLVANGAQYMRIVEMANRLQAQGAEDKKRWEAERTQLEQRIKVLEEAMVMGTKEPVDPKSSSELSSPKISTPSGTPQIETIHVLREEVGRLRLRTQTLEAALQTMRQESISIQAAARQIADAGGKIESTSGNVMAEGG